MTDVTVMLSPNDGIKYIQTEIIDSHSNQVSVLSGQTLSLSGGQYSLHYRAAGKPGTEFSGTIRGASDETGVSPAAFGPITITAVELAAGYIPFVVH